MNNIANVDTPGFTARRVEFEAQLQRAVDEWQGGGQLNLSRVRPAVKFQEFGMRFRMDGSNVDMDREMVSLYINSIRYDALANAVMHNSRMLGVVLSGR